MFYLNLLIKEFQNHYKDYHQIDLNLTYYLQDYLIFQLNFLIKNFY